MIRSALTVAIALEAMFLASPAALAREQVKVAGSSTVLPYANIVAEQFGRAFSNLKTPVVEGGGSSAGLKQFCAGLGEDKIDIANSSRQIKPSELSECVKNGVADIIEVKIGYDGIVFAVDTSQGEWKLEPKDLFQALSNEIVKDGALVPNSTKTWKDVNPALPDTPIMAFIPGEKHGTRDVFEEKVMAAGCKAAGAEALFLAKAEGADDQAKKKAAESACKKVRKDGAAVDIDGDYTETLARIQSNPTAIGVFGLAFFENNSDKLAVASISGVVPTAETVASSEYPVSRPLYFYVKKAHLQVIPGLKDYISFFTSDRILDRKAHSPNTASCRCPRPN